MVPLYIMGLLKRYGPQHGYQIKKTIAEQLADFTQMKLPTIYYHLTKMEADGLLSAVREKAGARPEKTVYSLTDKGEAAYRDRLDKLLAIEYRPAFDNDAVFFFSDHVRTIVLTDYLQTGIEKLKTALEVIDRHREETLLYVPDDAKTMTGILFSHHEHHHRAELAWMEETLQTLLSEGENHGETKDSRDR